MFGFANAAPRAEVEFRAHGEADRDLALNIGKANGSSGQNDGDAVAEPAQSGSDGPQAATQPPALITKPVASLGHIMTALMMSPHHQMLSVWELRQLVVPAIIVNQFSFAEAQTKRYGISAAVGAVLWASVSDQVSDRLIKNPNLAVPLEPEEWRSGPNIWVVEAVGEPRVVGAMINQLCQTAFRGHPFKIRTRDSAGRVSVKSLAADTV